MKITKNLSGLIFAILFYALCEVPVNLQAQARQTVLLPDLDTSITRNARKNSYLLIAADLSGNDTSRSFFEFNYNNLPLNADPTKLSFQLSIAAKGSTTSATQYIYLMQGAPSSVIKAGIKLGDESLAWSSPGNVPVGRSVVTNANNSLSFDMNLAGKYPHQFFFNQQGPLWLAARSPSKRQSNSFYSSYRAINTPAYKPRIVVQYDIGKYPFRNDWAQTFNNAQRSGYLNWATNCDIKSGGYQLLPNTSKDLYAGADPNGAMLIYKNKPLVFTQAASGKNVFFVKQLDINGNILWAQAVDNLAKCCPVIDELGRLYYFSLSGTLSILDLNNSGTFVTADGITYQNQPLSTIANNQAVKIVNGVTIGYDGTLYLSTNRGLLALSAYPQLKVRWKYDNSNKENTGPASLSADESKTFFISADTMQGTCRLMVLNNTDGTEIDESKPLNFGYKGPYSYLIPAPVVQGNTNIFLLSGFDNGGLLYRFGFNTSTNKLTNDVARVEADNTLNTGISQPVTGADSNVYFVFNNKIARYDSGKKNNVDFLNNSNYLDNASILVTDKSSNIYALDPYKHNVLCFSYISTGLNNVFTIGIDTTKKNVALATDGTIYTMNLNNIIAVRPVSVSKNDIAFSQMPDLNTNTLYRANNTITLSNFNVQNSINAVFYSGGSISFKPGFAVSQGAQLLFKTGFLKQ